ncbi:MAG: hypothetical protein ABI977_18930, partial [Acidobacteriota bacterium]
MFEQQIAREAPATLPGNEGGHPHFDISKEPVLAAGNIQGNIIGGFNKDHQTMLFLTINDMEKFRSWLRRFVPFIATAAEVWQFNKLFKAIRRRRMVETRAVQATWINIAFSFNALRKLTADSDALHSRAPAFNDYDGAGPDAFSAIAFSDQAFKEGLPARATSVLNDPPDESDLEGSPKNWLFGGPGNEPHIVIVVASDSADELHDEVGRIEQSIYSGRAVTGERAPSGLQIVYKQQGATLPPPLAGHEHFGFLDGVSQPGLRGLVTPGEVLTPRQNPDDPDQGKPGQDLLWPGEFVFGYPRQNPKPEEDGELNTSPGAVAADGPVWAKDGSFLVVRRLRQDVARFHKFLTETAKGLDMPRDRFGAKLVGRWPSGAPIMRRPDEDDPALGNDDCANNHFEFQEGAEEIEEQDGQHEYCADKRGDAPGDPDGAVCPFAGHIRKTYPRDDERKPGDGIDEETNETTTQTHRLLRRGIPFGDPYFPPRDPQKQKDDGNRGLLFAAYMTSITRQFEFVTQHWVNNPEFKQASDGNGGLRSGHDLIIGQANNGG